STLHLLSYISLFFFNAPHPSEIYTLSLHDALPICRNRTSAGMTAAAAAGASRRTPSDRCRSLRRCSERTRCCRRRARRSTSRSRSEEHTSELQSLRHLVCRLLLEKKKKKSIKN